MHKETKNKTKTKTNLKRIETDDEQERLIGVPFRRCCGGQWPDLSEPSLSAAAATALLPLSRSPPALGSIPPLVLRSSAKPTN